MGILICITISGIIITYPVYGNYFSSTSDSGLQLFWLFASIATGGVIITFTIIGLFKLINKLSKRGLIIFTIVLFAIYGISLIVTTYLFPTIPMTDSFYVHDQAIGMAKGKSDIINGHSGYFRKYSNNNPLIILLYFIYKIAYSLGIHNLLKVGRLFNAFCIFSGLMLFYFAINKISKRKTTGAKFLLLNLLFIPMIYMTPWVYTATICLPFMGGIMLCGTNLIKNQSRKSIIINSAIIGVLSIAGYNIRPVVIILSIAGFICLFLWTVKDKKRFAKSALMVGICAIFALGSFATTKALNNHYYTGSDANLPLTHWVAMGLTENGMYDTQLVDENVALNNTDEMKANSLRHIEERLNNYNFETFISHLYIKNGNIWANGSLEYPSRLTGSEKYTKLSVLLADSKSDFMCLYTQMLWLAFHILTLIYIIRFIFNKESKYGLLQILTLLGGYGFYMIWEVKSAYAIPFIFFIIGMATLGGESIEKTFSVNSTAKTKNVFKVVYSAVAIFSIVLMIIGTPFFTENSATVVDNKLRLKSTHNVAIRGVVKKNKTIKQEFYTKEKFNFVSVKVGRKKGKDVDQTYYEATLKNSKNQIIANNVFHGVKHRLPAQFINIQLIKPYVPTHKEKFTLTIKHISGYRDAYIFGRNKSENINALKGKLTVNGKKKHGDLRICVGEEHYQPLTTPFIYCILSIAIVIFELAIMALTFDIFKRKNKLTTKHN